MKTPDALVASARVPNGCPGPAGEGWHGGGQRNPDSPGGAGILAGDLRVPLGGDRRPAASDGVLLLHLHVAIESQLVVGGSTVMTFPVWSSLISGLVTAMFSSAVRCGLERVRRTAWRALVDIEFPAVPGS